MPNGKLGVSQPQNKDQWLHRIRIIFFLINLRSFYNKGTAMLTVEYESESICNTGL